jgi:ATP-dependent Clp protease adapter protein ClpS
MKHKLDKYDMILEQKGYNFRGSVEAPVEADIDVDTDSLTNLLEELGIKMSTEGSHKLLLWNDEVNDMLHVVLALYEICGLDNEEAMRIMLEAHNKGKAVAKSGTEKEMMKMKQGLNDRGIEATVEN